MRKIVDGTLAVMCVLTLANTDYSNIGVLDILLFVCMGVAVASALVLFMVRKKGGS